MQNGLVKHSFDKYIFFNLLKLKVTLHKENLPFDFEYWKKKGWLSAEFYSKEVSSKIKTVLAKYLVKLKIETSV